jgi:hypothetical protein
LQCGGVVGVVMKECPDQEGRGDIPNAKEHHFIYQAQREQSVDADGKNGAYPAEEGVGRGY